MRQDIATGERVPTMRWRSHVTWGMPAGLLIIGAVVAFAVFRPAPANGHWLVEPGVRLGPLRIGMLESEAVSALQAPARVKDCGTVSWELRFGDPPMVALFYHVRGRNPGGELISLTTRFGGFRMLNGAGVGVSQETVRRLLGHPLAGSDPATLVYSGIAFGMRDAKVATLTVIPNAAGTSVLTYMLYRTARDKGIPQFRLDSTEDITRLVMPLRDETSQEGRGGARPCGGRGWRSLGLL